VNGGGDRHRAVLVGARVVVAAVLAGESVLMLLHGRSHFEHFGLSERLRWTLGCLEILAAALFAVPRTLPLGATGLLMVLAYAAGLHAGLHQGAGTLFLWMLAVAFLAHLDVRLRLSGFTAGS
jgi:hypothetical protein